jgi:hypothetical protein
VRLIVAHFGTQQRADHAFLPVMEATSRESVSHYVPEKNPFVDEMTTKYNVAREAGLGYPEILYPEYQMKMKPAAPGR